MKDGQSLESVSVQEAGTIGYRNSTTGRVAYCEVETIIVHDVNV